MNEQEALNKFAVNFLQEVISLTDSQENGEFKINTFTRAAGDYLYEAGEIDEINICYYKNRGMQVNGYNVSQDEDCIDLFISIFTQQVPPTKINKSQIETALRQAEGILKKAFEGYHTYLEESSEIFDMFQRLYQARNQVTRARIFLLTDGIANVENMVSENKDNISISYHIWDIGRLYRFASSGEKLETIEIDFEHEFGIVINCLSLVDHDSDYKGYLAVIPGEVLAKVYEKYGSRLLERNVRSFLQVRGNINKGIRKTILEEPHRFFAYNNGISATADVVGIKKIENDLIQIKTIRNLQIVNGGQTTASLYHATKKDKANLKGINVQMKLTVIPPDQLDNIVPLISRYANSQNKINDADFYANDPFHVKIEELSRTVWVPALGGTNKQTKWFYERSRGQYLDLKTKEGTPSRMRQFEKVYPKAQQFSKTDLSKFVNTWEQLPYVVSMGAQKNFNHFSIQLKEHGKIEVEKSYYEHLIAKAILFKRAEKVISALNFGGYRANIVTYTLAWLSYHTNKKINLDRIWQDQDITPALQEAIQHVSKEVYKIITTPPDAKNITEWCKKNECWDLICKLNIPLSENFKAELAEIPFCSWAKFKELEVHNEQDIEVINSVSKISHETWYNIAKKGAFRLLLGHV